jgi:hypothetical protein
MKHPAPGACPVCGEQMHITRLACAACDSALEGQFTICKFCRLSPEQQHFLEVFLVNRGNIREMERVLGISYPTVRSRLDSIIEALGYTVDREEQADQEKRRTVLEALDKGEMSVQDVLRSLKG